jgi:hypothetical protein
MKDQKLFVVEIKNLNRRVKIERALDDFLNYFLEQKDKNESFHSATRELVERYMSVVRSRNKVRRNWHPDKALACDLQTLQWIEKDKLRGFLGERLRKKLVASSSGTKVLTEDLIQTIVDETVDEIYKPNRKNSNPSTLEKIVRQIYKWNPDVTDTDVINEMKSTPEKFGIVDINDTHVVIRVPKGIGKQYEDKPRSLATIKNILTRIKASK